MPKASEQQLRGLMAQAARVKGDGGLDRLNRPDINKALRGKGFDQLVGTEMTPIKEALKAGPYPTRAPAVFVPFSFEYWFNYFFAELPASTKLDFALHVVNDDGTLRSEAEVPGKIGLFQKMATLGFRRFTAQDHLSAEQLRAHAARDNPLQQSVNILFRGDSRLPEAIKAQGTRPQTQVQYLHETRGMQRPWHPFLNAGTSVWVRNGEVNKDNCLFSAVSVTPQFFVATKFPLLDGLMGESPHMVGHALVVVRDKPGGVPGQSGVKAARALFEERTLRLRASKTNIYGVAMRGAYNTQAYQLDAPFPEYASDNLTWADHLVWFSVVRIHYGTGANDGHLIVIDDHRFLQDRNTLAAAVMGPTSVAALKSFVADVAQRGRLLGKLGGIAYTPPGVSPPFEIVKVEVPFIR